MNQQSSLTINHFAQPPKVTRLPIAHTSASLILSEVEFSLAYYSRESYQEAGITCPISIARTRPIRQAEFLAGRIAARSSLTQLGMSYEEITMNADRSPAFPAGSTGSISHSRKTAVALVGRQSPMCNFIGVDIETVMTPQQYQDVLPLIANQQERDILMTLDKPIAAGTTLLFSAKEAIYKAIYPTVKEILDFDSVRLNRITGNTLYFTSAHQLKAYSLPPELTCHYAWRDNEVLTYSII